MKSRGFTLVELVVTVAIVAILGSVALPAYNRYVFRSRISPALYALNSFQAQMEQRYQDVNNYGIRTCLVETSTVSNFAISCALTLDGQGFTATATGSGPVAGVVYSIDQNATRITVAHPYGVPTTVCWSIRGTTCDS